MAVLGQNWEENNCLRHQNISAPLDGMYGSKAVDKTLLEVSSKIGEAKSKKELEFFQRHGFWLWPRTWRASYPQNVDKKTFFLPLPNILLIPRLNANNKIVAAVYDGNLSQGQHDVPMEIKTLAPGQYFVQIQKSSGTITTKLSKVK